MDCLEDKENGQSFCSIHVVGLNRTVEGSFVNEMRYERT